MFKTLLSLSVVAVAAAALLYVAKTNSSTDSPAIESAIGGASGPPIRSVCVQPVQNLAKRPLDMAGLDTALVNQLRHAKVPAELAPIDGGSEGCAAFVYTEITEVAGNGRTHADLEFRVVMKDEVPPRLSSTARGKSGNKLPPMMKEGFLPASEPIAPPHAPGTGPERDAIIAAFVDQASQIAVAHRWGFPSQTSSTK